MNDEITVRITREAKTEEETINDIKKVTFLLMLMNIVEKKEKFICDIVNEACDILGFDSLGMCKVCAHAIRFNIVINDMLENFVVDVSGGAHTKLMTELVQSIETLFEKQHQINLRGIEEIKEKYLR